MARTPKPAAAKPPPAFAKNAVARLPIRPPYSPMEAEQVAVIPSKTGWQYEPKWDGFRCVVFRDGDEVVLQSKSGRPLGRYFPEIVATIKALRVRQLVLDGELVVPLEDRLSFEELQLRLHPAASRVRMLAEARPARLILFDLLVDARGRDWTSRPLSDRRSVLEKLFPSLAIAPLLQLSPATRDLRQARRWLSRAGGDLDGIVAKRLDAPYGSGTRDAMVKVKNIRTVDCVVGGFRYGENSGLVGSLLLGLYDDAGLLHHVGFTSALADEDKPQLTRRLKKLFKPPGFTGNAPGGPSRWSTRRTAEWQPLAPELVVEVTYDHVTGGRFRHGTGLVRWRPDKAPRQCALAQILQSKRRQLSVLKNLPGN
jgi:ATP-dependent DNA ligase